jgi:hypothetical protein
VFIDASGCGSTARQPKRCPDQEFKIALPLAVAAVTTAQHRPWGKTYRNLPKFAINTDIYRQILVFIDKN